MSFGRAGAGAGAGAGLLAGGRITITMFALLLLLFAAASFACPPPDSCSKCELVVGFISQHKDLSHGDILSSIKTMGELDTQTNKIASAIEVIGLDSIFAELNDQHSLHVCQERDLCFHESELEKNCLSLCTEVLDAKNWHFDFFLPVAFFSMMAFTMFLFGRCCRR